MTRRTRKDAVPAPTSAPTEAAAVYVAIDSLVPWDRNPRKNDAAIPEVAGSIKRFGFGAPIIARLADRRIIAGHTRWAAAKSLGLEQVPVRFLDLSEDEATALTLADNKLGELSEWNDAELADLLRGLHESSVDLAGLGWDQDALANLLADPVLDPAHAFGRLPNSAPEVVGMTFTLSRAQRESVQSALVAARAAGPFAETGNTNGNGNALARICDAYLDRQGS